MVSEATSGMTSSPTPWCLNPYYAGIWSRSQPVLDYVKENGRRLNPYYAGIWSRSGRDHCGEHASGGS